MPDRVDMLLCYHSEGYALCNIHITTPNQTPNVSKAMHQTGVSVPLCITSLPLSPNPPPNLMDHLPPIHAGVKSARTAKCSSESVRNRPPGTGALSSHHSGPESAEFLATGPRSCIWVCICAVPRSPIDARCELGLLSPSPGLMLTGMMRPPGWM